MEQCWRWLTFLHWQYPPAVVQERLPAGLRVDLYDGVAWVGLVPFLMDGLRLRGTPALPWISRFPETNVRTYVRGPDGKVGIYFLSLDAARLPGVALARVAFGLPYCWARMRVRRQGREVWYQCRRRWPGPTGVGCDLRVEIGPACSPALAGGLDHFLTERYRLYSQLAGRLLTAQAAHRPWQLRQARVKRLRQDLLGAAGLPTPPEPPLVRASIGVPVRIGGWRTVGRVIR